MKNSITFLFLSCFTFQLFAQGYNLKSKDISIASKVYDKDRMISVFTPEAYDASLDQKYQVLYVFDGQWGALFNLVSSVNTYLSESGYSQDFIIIGIHTENRPSEFTPAAQDERTEENWGTKVGQADLLDQHLLEEVIPYIEKNYRVHPYRIGIGHSLGGTYVINALMETPGLFNGCIAVSPNLVYDYKSMLKRYEQELPKVKTKNSFAYISVGDQGNMETNFGKGVRLLDSLLKETTIEGFHYKFDYLEDTNHMTSFARSITNSLIEYNELFGAPSEEFVTGLMESPDFMESLKAFYQKHSDWLGYDFAGSESELNNIAYSCLYAEKPELGIEVLDWAISLYPAGINLYDSRAEMYLESGQKEKAIFHYGEGLQKLKDAKANIPKEDYDYFFEMLNANLENAKKKE